MRTIWPRRCAILSASILAALTLLLGQPVVGQNVSVLEQRGVNWPAAAALDVPFVGLSSPASDGGMGGFWESAPHLRSENGRGCDNPRLTAFVTGVTAGGSVYLIGLLLRNVFGAEVTTRDQLLISGGFAAGGAAAALGYCAIAGAL